MENNQSGQPQQEKGSSSGEAWQEVGRQFEALGDSLAQALRTAWKDEGNRQKVKEMQNGLESMVKKIDQAIQEKAATPEGQQIKEEAKKAAENLRTAGQQTYQEVRPRLVTALQQLNSEIQKMIDRMEQGK
ncbi:MAG: hypothetical protein M1281_18265 [Chloroflexi bacterium]|nr:hypothetical protein [Chloroflexota bacterium]